MANKFTSSAKNYTSSNKFIEDYEKLLKKNTGSSLLFAQDTGFNPSYNLTNQPVVAPLSAEGGLSAPQMSTNYQAPPRREYAALPEAVEPEGAVMGASDELPENPTAEQMLQAIFKAAWEPQLPTSEDLEQRYQETGEAYPVMSMEDGTVQYNDGSFRAMDAEAPPMPIASMADGSVLWSDGFTREMPADGLSSYLAGVSGLSQFIFGEDQTVTQDYGNINPELGYGESGHLGTDFRTQDLATRNLFAPVEMTVVQVITEDMGSPYGNSVLVRLPSGEMLRLSHLSSLGEFQEGQTLQPGELIGTPGSTGNSTAEHLDVEYYNTEGQLDNPNNFKANVSQYSIANQIVGVSPYQNTSQTQEEPQQESTLDQIIEPLQQAAQPVMKAAQSVMEPIQQATQQLGTSAANSVDALNPTGTNIDFGLTEKWRGQDQLANQKLASTAETVGQATGLPEMGVSEAALQGGLTGAVRQLAGNTVDTLSTPLKKLGVPDVGFSEWLANNKTVNTDANLAPQSFAYDPSGNPIASKAPEYGKVLGQNVQDVLGEAKKAGSNLLSSAAKSVDDYADKVTAQAGQGVSALKNGAQDLAQNIFKKPEVSSIGAKKLIGEDGMSGENQAPGSLLDMNKVGVEGDNRDAFFKYGGADAYKEYLNTGVNSGYKGALNFNLFKDTVFDSPDAIGNIFGNTYLGKEATDKYRSRESMKYPLMSFNPMGYEDGYDRGDIDNYNRSYKGEVDKYNKGITDYLGSIPNVFSGTNWQMGSPASAKNAFASASLQTKTPENRQDKALMSMAPMSTPNRGMSANVIKPNMKPTINTALMSMNKPQMSMAPIAKPQKAAPKMSVSRPSAPKASSAPRPNPTPTINKSLMSMAPKPTPKPASKAPVKASYSANSSQRNQPYPIMSMKNGQVKYSDGSIRSR